ncbi:hypothetical protein HanRHA438_Chr07g0291041 [Helianthus annuus]|uniref:Uncharacterized protein n=1 Tax=Helianthus annuus TaxID=4232 RepID=A0A251UA47_HELAN|nr:hypothetical protein HanXRQr2_Chr07g0280411 [Helianthus annuus]KAJ0549171.1 hypothetical protein HanHA300_Chr07g0230451 [Helianthus annuus]KAJ0562123.1 hypothetical protein HanHA89_Chr07g0247591 [Helianthus annuus]KAJ0727500.1 hypothetical protein HanLR1_Chr07g0230431 [Helianthus annuus]KAJ0730295.1 hypothetical protein HanOQP8_Chr07g0238331 [Helianthus annuus]
MPLLKAVIQSLLLYSFFKRERREKPSFPSLQSCQVTDFNESIWLHALNFEIQIPLSILSQFLHLARVVEKLCLPATSGGDGD